MPLKSSADKEDKNTSTKLIKSVKVYVLEKDRNTILSNGRLDDNFINESQNILKKQFPSIGGWKDTLLCQTSFSAVSEESVQITTLGKIVGFFQRRSTNICGFTTVRPARNGWTWAARYLRLPRWASGSALSADRQTLNDFVIVKVLFRIPQQLIIIKIWNKIEFDVIVSTTVKT